ncbi:MAG: divalent-cation tolerance protein CutA [Acidobacteria bacterium]|nr:divalent-cation tolerance protein CutA [Acidobacteriota bacterium]
MIMIVVLTTTPTELEAESLAKKIIEAKLASCVQVLPKMKSFYFWEGELKQEAEYLLLIKTLDEKFPKLEEFIKENHSYELPEVVALKAERISQRYLDWISESIG